MQRTARIKANQIQWPALRNLESDRVDIDDEVTIDPANNHQVRPAMPIEDKVLTPDTYKYATGPLEVTTSEEATTLPKKTGKTRETVDVMTDSPGVGGYLVAKVSLKCRLCAFKTEGQETLVHAQQK